MAGKIVNICTTLMIPFMLLQAFAMAPGMRMGDMIQRNSRASQVANAIRMRRKNVNGKYQLVF